jgi:carbon-monoxide dehydrogenase small subunit
VTARRITLTVDGVRAEIEATPGTSLLRALRDHGTTSVLGACEQGECGSCSVLLDGRLECSCLVPAVICDGSTVATAASLLPADLAEALARHGAVQCGFCTPGIVVAAVGLLDASPGTGRDGPLSSSEVREGLAGNLCRCTGYEGIVDAVVETDRIRRGSVTP